MKITKGQLEYKVFLKRKPCQEQTTKELLILRSKPMYGLKLVTILMERIVLHKDLLLLLLPLDLKVNLVTNKDIRSLFPVME